MKVTNVREIKGAWIDKGGRLHVPAGIKQALLDEFEISGTTAVEFTAKKCIEYGTFMKWRRKRRGEQGSASGADGGAETSLHNAERITAGSTPGQQKRETNSGQKAATGRRAFAQPTFTGLPEEVDMGGLDCLPTERRQVRFVEAQMPSRINGSGRLDYEANQTGPPLLKLEFPGNIRLYAGGSGAELQSIATLIGMVARAAQTSVESFLC